MLIGSPASHRVARLFSAQTGTRQRGLTLAEVMISLILMATVMLGFISAFIQSRRVTESSVLHAAATSMIYGLVEQIKELDYTTLVPSYEVDPYAPTGTGAPTPPYVRLERYLEHQ